MMLARAVTSVELTGFWLSVSINRGGGGDPNKQAFSLEASRAAEPSPCPAPPRGAMCLMRQSWVASASHPHAKGFNGLNHGVLESRLFNKHKPCPAPGMIPPTDTALER